MEFVDRLPLGFSLVCKDNGKVVGRAHISIDGHEGVLEDIVVNEFSYQRFALFPFFKKNFSYRNKGYGTSLLHSVIQNCKKFGLSKLSGDIVGDAKRLGRWYSRNGFTVSNGKITKDLL